MPTMLTAPRSVEVQSPNVLQADREASTAATNGVSSDHQLWHEIVSKRHSQQRVDTFEQSVIMASYVDQSLKRGRGNSLRVTGLAPMPTRTDTELFANLRVAAIQMQPDIIAVKRLGQPQVG
jgi:hypothetical protein